MLRKRPHSTRTSPKFSRRHLRHTSHHLLNSASHQLQSQLHQSLDQFQQSLTHTKQDLSTRKDAFINNVEHWIEKASREAGEKRLLHLHELPRNRQDNPFILTGYRYVSSSLACLASWFYLHNESVNIWTHVLAFLHLLLVDSYHTHRVVLQDAVLDDHIVFFVFYLAAYACLLCSAMFHTFLGHSCNRHAKRAARADYVGIALLISASVGSIVWFTFYCYPVMKRMYLGLVMTAGIVGTLMPLFEWFDNSRYRVYRVMVFILQACVGAVPAMYLLYEHDALYVVWMLRPLILSFSAYLGGVYFFIYRVPESWWPGKFDYWGASHQIWHIAVILGIWLHKEALVVMYEQRLDFGIGCRAS